MLVPPMNRCDTRPVVVDLFSGAGGTSLGFVQAGFRILAAVEIDLNAAETYEKNLCVRVKKTDIRKLNPSRFRRHLGLRRGQLDVLVGCPPCQGFSRMRNGGGANDDKNDLVLVYLEFVKALLPRFAVFENVPGIIRTKHGKTFYDKLISGLKALGYNPSPQEVDAADFGVAQHRRRVIVIAARDNHEAPRLSPTHGNPKSPDVRAEKLQRWITVQNKIGNGVYPELKAGGDGTSGGKYPNHVAAETGPKVLTFIKAVPQDGGSRTDIPKESWLACHKKHDGHKDTYGRLHWDEPSNTITSGCTNPSKGRFVHPEQDRALTPREAAALQGFPDSFVFHAHSIPAQIGNAVPPPLANAIAEAIKPAVLAGRTNNEPQDNVKPLIPVDRLKSESAAHVHLWYGNDRRRSTFLPDTHHTEDAADGILVDRNPEGSQAKAPRDRATTAAVTIEVPAIPWSDAS